MNPSIEDLGAAAIEKVPAECVYVLPNNKNILLAAEQVAQLVEDKRGRSSPPVPSRRAFRPSSPSIPTRSGGNLAAMNKAIEDAPSCCDVRRARYAPGRYRNPTGDILGMRDGDLVLTGATKEEVALALLAQAVQEDRDHHHVLRRRDCRGRERRRWVNRFRPRFPTARCRYTTVANRCTTSLASNNRKVSQKRYGRFLIKWRKEGAIQVFHVQEIKGVGTARPNS